MRKILFLSLVALWFMGCGKTHPVRVEIDPAFERGSVEKIAVFRRHNAGYLDTTPHEGPADLQRTNRHAGEISGFDHDGHMLAAHVAILIGAMAGKVIHRQVGALPEPMLRDVVSQFLNVVNDAKVEAETN